jgi:signal transduction histidine kinase
MRGPDAMPAGRPSAADNGDLPAAQHAALRRIAALAGARAPASELFGAVLREVMVVLGLPRGWLYRYEPGPAICILASENYPPFPAGSRWPLDGPSTAARIRDTGQPARLDDHSGLEGTIARRVRDLGLRSMCGVPIVVDGGVWGGIGVGPEGEEPLPAETTDRLTAFTELVAGVIASAASQDRLARLADHRTSLSRIATLVAEESPAADLLAAIMAEATRVLSASAMIVGRYEAGDAMMVVASADAPRFPVGSRWPLDGPSLSARVYASGRPARIDDYSELSSPLAAGVRDSGLGSAIGVPILAGGRIWGIGCVAMRGPEPLPASAEDRLQDFTDLLGLAIANAESRRRTHRLTREQAALRRVATLVAEGAGPAELFSAVADEVARVLDVAAVSVVRFESGTTAIVVASHNDPGFPVGSRTPLDRPGLGATVFETGRPARLGDDERPPAASAQVAVPITVEGRVWGMIAVALRSSREARPAHAGILTSRLVLSDAPAHEVESRLAGFTELVATAIANADSHDQLTASRARVLIEADEARRRVVRDLHDGAQQRLIEAILTLELARARAPSADPEQDSLVADALDQLKQGVEELRELAHGVLPRVLTNLGLRAGLTAVVARLDLPVDVDVPEARYPVEIEASAYFIVAEALTNVSKHARATRAEVRVEADGGVLRIEVRDDGAGGADASGHGLVGLEDRATALGGRFEVESPPGGGTRLTATLPLTAV